MSERPLDPLSLRRQLEHVAKRPKSGAGPVALHATGGWAGAPTIEAAGTTWRVRAADSVLAFREALREDAPGRLVLLTPLDARQIGADAVARLAEQKVFRLRAWDLVLAHFNARQADVRLFEKAWAPLADALLETPRPDDAPEIEWLGPETAWLEWMRGALGFAEPVLDGPAVVRWALSPSAAARWRAQKPELRQAAAGWLEIAAGDAGRVVAAFLEGDRPAFAGAAVLACDLLHRAADAPQAAFLAQALRMVAPLALEPKVAANVARALVDALRVAPAPEVAPAGAALDELVRQAGQEALLVRSPYSPAGLRARLLAFAAALGDRDPAWDALRPIEQHALLDDPGALRVERFRMLARLHAWLRGPKGVAGGLDEAVIAYVERGAWVDRARSALARGDVGPELTPAARRLLDEAAARRAAENEAFARGLAAWTRSPHPLGAALPLESVVERVVAPLGEEAPVLLLVLDGLSLSVALDLLEDLPPRTFQAVEPTPIAGVRAGLAPVPTVTQLARCSLFSGEVRAGGQDREKSAFAAHAALARRSKAGKPPVVFHKADLEEPDRVRDAVFDVERRFVAVVVNAIDDQLGGARQLDPRWRIGAINPLGTLLEHARGAGRTVVLTSDHGHVWHESPDRRAGSDGARWRAGRDTGAGELCFEGERVRPYVAGGAAVAPFAEGVLYGAPDAAGYHGGATPQEVCVPLLVLWPVTLAEKMPPLRTQAPPPFWAPPEALIEAPPAPAAVPVPVSTGPQLGLFASAPATPQGPGAALVKSDLYRARAETAGNPVKADEVRTLVDLLAQAPGHRETTARVAAALGRSEPRVPGLVSQAQRLLNADGVPVLTHDREASLVRLDVLALRKQFELSE